MKSISSLLLLLMFSTSVYSAQALEKESKKRPGFIEKRQQKAREIMKTNFETLNPDKKEDSKESDFGYHKKKPENISI